MDESERRAGDTSIGGGACTSVDTPAQVDRYLVRGELGRGGFGTVYEVVDTISGETLALKVVRLDERAAAERLLREARVAAMLDHPSIVKVRDAGTTDTAQGVLAFVAMERLHGTDLRTVLLSRGGRLAIDTATEIALQLLDALASAHARDVVHRDVKPGNVFVIGAPASLDMPTFEVKLLDFGISRFSAGTSGFASRTAPGSALGTPGYMAPEQLGSAHTAGPRADVYAVGATLFEMLTGQLPFPASNASDWQARAMFERAPALASVMPDAPSAIASVVDRALARDPDARWADAAVFRDALAAACAGGEPAQAAETTAYAALADPRADAAALAPTVAAHTVDAALAGRGGRGGTDPLAPPLRMSSAAPQTPPARHPAPQAPRERPAAQGPLATEHRARDPLLRAALVAACIACVVALLSAALVAVAAHGRDGRARTQSAP